MLDELAALGPFFAVSAHPARSAPADPWRPVSDLAGNRGVLRARLEAVRAALAARAVAHVEPRIAASALQLGLTARLVSPALGAAALGHPIDPRPDRLWWQDVPGSLVPLSVPGHCESPAHDWQSALIDNVLAPIAAATAELAPVSGRVLWGNVASAVNAAAAQVARQRPDLADDAWQLAASLFASPRLRSERKPPGPDFRRSSCCLYYRLAFDRTTGLAVAPSTQPTSPPTADPAGPVSQANPVGPASPASLTGSARDVDPVSGRRRNPAGYLSALCGDCVLGDPPAP